MISIRFTKGKEVRNSWKFPKDNKNNPILCCHRNRFLNLLKDDLKFFDCRASVLQLFYVVLRYSERIILASNEFMPSTYETIENMK